MKRLTYHAIVVYSELDTDLPSHVNVESGTIIDDKTTVDDALTFDDLKGFHDAANKIMASAHALADALRRTARRRKERSS